MNQQQVMCVRLPLRGVSLLLPYACVAEIVSLTLRPQDSAFLGEVDWRGIRIPVVSLERGCNNPIDVAQGRVRLAVLYGLHDPARMPYYAVLLNGVPRTEGLTSEQLEETVASTCELFGLGVTVAGQAVFVPDLEGVESWLQAARSDQAAS